MKKRPYFVCSKCGKYNDVFCNDCICGQPLEGLEYEVYEGILPIDLCGDVDMSVPVYIQKCPRCSRLNFTNSADKPVEVCRLCRNYRIGSESEPVLFDGGMPNRPVVEPEIQTQPTVEPEIQIQPVAELTIVQPEVDELQSDNIWLELLGLDDLPKDDVYATTGQTSNPPHKPSIQLRSTPAFPSFSQTFRPKESEVLVGRDAQCADYLYGKDGRVSNEHCFLIYRDGKWYVRDCSRNGTQINGRSLPKGEEIELPDNAELKLGKWNDSMAFTVHYLV